MKFRLSALVVAVTVIVAAPRLSAQAVATATGKALAVGAAYETGNPDYGPYGSFGSSGLAIFANYDFSRYIGATVEVNLQTAFSHVIFLEKTYMVGARGEYHYGRFMPYAKILIGGAHSAPNGNYNLINAPDGFPVAAFGGGLEYRADHHITVRIVDYESQHWLEYHPNGLTPDELSFGAAYRF